MYHDYASKLLADYRSDPPLWESDLPRHNRYSDNILNSRYCGNKNGAAPVYNEYTNSPEKAEKGLQLSDLRNFFFYAEPSAQKHWLRRCARSGAVQLHSKK
ncbi:hypothetical protein ASFV_Kyiv_2016_131_00118 [African swine fever virus]|uniref:Minor capsid protein p49 n=1 Tax=African swine fever virus TaxID=10497 RepID=A0A5B8XA96_ASF|nr:hypothetical protein ASFV_Kyiv_2016_131_00118 [African swine fever virus]